MVDNITAAFSSADASNAKYYAANAATFKKQLTKLDADFKKRLASCKTRTMTMIANNIFCQILDQAKNAKPTKAITDLIDNQVLIIGDILNENVRTLVPLVQVAVSPAWCHK